MRIASGIWGRLCRRFGGIRKHRYMHFWVDGGLTSIRFLVKDAQDDLASERLKA